MSWLSRLFRRSSPLPEIQSPKRLQYDDVEPNFDTLDEAAKQDGIEHSLSLGIFLMDRNAGRSWSGWRVALKDLKRRGLTTNNELLAHLVDRTTHDHRNALESQEQLKWHVEGRPWYEEFKIYLAHATNRVENIEDCLRYLQYLARRRPAVQARWDTRRMERNTAPATAPSRRQGRL